MRYLATILLSCVSLLAQPFSFNDQPFMAQGAADPNANLLVNLTADWWFSDAADGSPFGNVTDHSGNGYTMVSKNSPGVIGNSAQAFGNFTLVANEETAAGGGDIQCGFCGPVISFPANQIFTVSTWVKLAATTASAPTVDNWSANGFYLGQSGGNKWTFGIHDSGNTSHFVDDASTSTGSWFLLTGGWDGVNIWIQVNAGTRTTSAVATSHDSVEHTAVGSYSIGTSACGAFNSIPTRGYIGRTCIWFRTLSTVEVTQVYNSGNGIAVAY